MVRWASPVMKMKHRAVAGPLGGRRGAVVDADRADVVGEDVAELVVADPADEAGPAAERGDAGRGVAGRPARGLDRRSHVGVDLVRRVLVDELIEPLTMPWLSRKASSVWVSTSTMALPIAMTSRDLAGMGASVGRPATGQRVASTPAHPATTGSGSAPSTHGERHRYALTDPTPDPGAGRARPALTHRHDRRRQPLPAAPHGGAVALRPRARARPGGLHLHRHLRDRPRGRRGHPHRGLQRHRARGLGRRRRVRRRHPPRGDLHQPRRGDPSASPSPSPPPSTPGTWALHTEFTGILNDKLHGFYRSTFTDDDGVDQVIATTQFEATDARRAFPCWDEPDFKAVFGITLAVPAELTAVSNAAEVSRSPRDDGKHVVRFADTMSMSTYLVAFIVGPLDITDPVDVDGTPLRIVYPVGKGHLTGYALEVGAFCLRFFADYFGVPYPGDKVDLVAVPDFAFGAMENLGCITFREALVLVDPDEVTQPELQRVTDVIAHELAHMWFGDLVTMKWWNGIWLNEAFATFMEMLATDAFKPEWDRWSDFGLSRTAAFDTDSLDSHPTHRVRGRVAHRRRGHVRRAHLREGRSRRPHARAVPRRQPVPRGHPPLHQEPRLREHRDHRPVGRHRVGHRGAGAGDHGHLDLPGRLPARHRRPGQRRQRCCASARSASATPATSARATPTAIVGARRTSAGRCRSSSASRPTTSSPSRRCSRRRLDRRRPDRGRSTGCWPTPRAPASTGWPTPPTCGPPSSPRPRPTSPPSSATA